jgi:SecD/SecF fusion protein
MGASDIMERGSLIFRTVIVVVVVTVFALSLHPLVQRDYYAVFIEMLRDKTQTPKAQELVAKAKALQKEDPALYQSQALLRVADESGTDLTSLVKTTGDIQNNRDVLSLIRKNASSSIRLGLDLNGGVEFYLELVPDEELLERFQTFANGKGETRADMEKRMKDEFDRYRDNAIEILRNRLEGQKIFEAEIAPSGDRYVALRAPVVAKDEKLKLLELIKMSAQLRFRLVHVNNAELVRQYLADPKNFRTPLGYELMTVTEVGADKRPEVRYYFVSRRIEMDGKGVSMAYPAKDQWGKRQIDLRFSPQGAEDFARVTTANVHRQLAIVLDGKLYCAPNIKEPITGGGAVINGSFSEDEAKSIADALVSGSFPFQIKVNAVFDTDPKLGAANVSNGIWVGIFSLLCVALFMIVYYRLCGVIAVCALCLNVVLVMGAMAAFDSTLTLPGIAGIILTIGMAVDANVLVFERIREELANGHKLRTAVGMGYERAFSAVFDANITTLLTSFILMFVGTGAVKGFAVTLSIGILSTLFTALFVTRLIFDYILKFSTLEHISMMHIFKNATYKFMKMWRWALVFSGVLILLLAGTLIVRGRSVLGVDFTGGTSVSFSYAEQVPQEEIEKFLRAQGYDEPSVTYKFNAAAQDGKKVEITVRGDLSQGTGEELAARLNKQFPQAHFDGGLESSIGGLIGHEFIKAALYAIVLSLIGIGIYISLRYEFLYAVSGVLMLLHDVAVVLAIYLATGRTLSLSAVAALLTVIGYSINDNVVIFDRMRENLKLGVSKNFGEIVDLSVNQTLSRTMITSVTTFIVVFILFLAGGVAINDFVLIMMLGVILGTYSSVFLAAPTVAYMRRKDDRGITHPAKTEGGKC